jgi:hypothetical protein
LTALVITLDVRVTRDVSNDRVLVRLRRGGREDRQEGQSGDQEEWALAHGTPLRSLLLKSKGDAITRNPKDLLSRTLH